MPPRRRMAMKKRRRVYRRKSFKRRPGLAASRLRAGRKTRIVKGRGDFWGGVKQFGKVVHEAAKGAIPKGTLEKIGRKVGDYYGGPVGTAIGGYAGGQIAELSGVGDYKMRRGGMKRMNMGQPVPSFGNLANGVIISHREYLGDLVSQGTGFYNTSAFPINPGQSATFPWLSTVADSFEMYQMVGCVFEFKSTSSEFSSVTGGALGSIILATDYNSGDNNFTSKQTMENAQYTVSAKPSESVIHPIECDPRVNALGKNLYIRAGSLPSGQDIKTYDIGKFQIATSGVQATSGTVLGEIWVSYKVKLFKPTLENAATGMAHIISTSPTYTSLFGTTTNLPVTGSTLSLSAINNIVTFPQVVGNYYCVLTLFGTAISTVLTLSSETNCSVNTSYLQGGSVSSVAGFQSTQNLLVFVIQVTNQNAQTGVPSVTIGASTTSVPSSPASYGLDLYVTELPANLIK